MHFKTVNSVREWGEGKEGTIRLETMARDKDVPVYILSCTLQNATGNGL